MSLMYSLSSLRWCFCAQMLHFKRSQASRHHLFEAAFEEQHPSLLRGTMAMVDFRGPSLVLSTDLKSCLDFCWEQQWACDLCSVFRSAVFGRPVLSKSRVSLPLMAYKKAANHHGFVSKWPLTSDGRSWLTAPLYPWYYWSLWVSREVWPTGFS